MGLREFVICLSQNQTSTLHIVLRSSPLILHVIGFYYQTKVFLIRFQLGTKISQKLSPMCHYFLVTIVSTFTLRLRFQGWRSSTTPVVWQLFVKPNWLLSIRKSRHSTQFAYDVNRASPNNWLAFYKIKKEEKRESFFHQIGKFSSFNLSIDEGWRGIAIVEMEKR